LKANRRAWISFYRSGNLRHDSKVQYQKLFGFLKYKSFFFLMHP
jgi:hypothetical protein